MKARRFLHHLVIPAVVALPSRSAHAQGASPATSPGVVEFEISCEAEAQESFNRGVALLHHMTYPNARAEFSSIAIAHPTCAMAHWGVAMTLFQPLWPTRPSPDDLRRGWVEVSEALRPGTTTAKEREFIATAAAFFDPAAGEYWERVRSWASATQQLYERFPDDVEARAFHALALLATAPASGDPSQNAEAAALLATIMREQPGHPGAIHYTIHANDADGRQGESTDVVRGYARVAPRNPHALHMPTHIFVRLGDWQEVINGNEAAAAAALEHRSGDARQWTWDEFPHAIEYLVYAHLQVGDDAAAEQAMKRLTVIPDLEPSFKTAFHLSSIPARYVLERGDWAAAARLEPRVGAGIDWVRFPWPEAVTWFARGVGSARSGDAAGARAAQVRLTELRDVAEQAGEILFARQTEILRMAVTGWLARLEGDETEAVRLLEEAVSLEASTPKHAVTPAPTIPASEMLGDLLFEMGDPAAALESYSYALRAFPNRFNGLLGAARAARVAGDSALAARFYGDLRALAVESSPRDGLAEANSFLRR